MAIQQTLAKALEWFQGKFCHRPPRRPTLLVLACLSWILSLTAVSKCTFVIRTIDDEEASFGLFSQAVYDVDNSILGCVQYDTNDFGSQFKAGKAFGVLTAILSTGVLLAVSAALTFMKRPHSQHLWVTSRVLFVSSTFSQLFTFLALGGCDDDCRLSGAGAAAVLNVFVLTSASVLAVITPAPAFPWLAWAEPKCCDSDRIAFTRTGQVDDESGELQFAETSSSQATDNAANNNRDSGWGSVFENCLVGEGNFLEMELEEDDEEEDGRGARPHSTPSVISVGASTTHTDLTVTDSLILAAGVQRLKRFRLTFFGLIVFAWILSIVGVHRCTFLLVGPAEGNSSTYSGLGLYTRASYDDNEIIGCLAYPDNIRSNFESSFTAARVFGAVTGFLMTSVLLLVAFQLFANIAMEEVWLVIRCLLPSSAVSQLLTFVAYKNQLCTSDSLTCVPGGTGIMVIINIILLLVLSAVTFRICPPGGAVFEKYNPPVEEPASNNNQVPQSDSKDQSQRSSSGRNSSRRLGPHRKCDATESDSEEEQENRKRTSRVRIAPLPPITRDSDSLGEQVEIITIRVEFTPTEKKTIKEIVHPDGSKTLTTTIEELDDDDADADEASTEDDDETGLASLQSSQIEQATADP